MKRLFYWPNLDQWTQLSPWIRYPVATGILLGSILGGILTGFHRAWGIGIILGLFLLFCGPSAARKRGYHDF
jgi:hypothetical protein